MGEPPSAPFDDPPNNSAQPDRLLAAAVLLLVIDAMVGLGMMVFSPTRGAIFLGATTPVFVVATLVAINRTDRPNRMILTGCMFGLGAALVSIAFIVWIVADFAHTFRPGQPP